MSSVLENIKTRRSVRKYKPDPVPRELIEKVIEAGTYAATGRGQQSPVIIAVTNKALREKITKLNAEIFGRPGFDKLKIGDVLVYKKENKVILHRIVKIDDSSGKYIYNTKGDNNKSIDSWDIQEKDVIGKVRFKIALVGYPTVWLNRLFEGGN